MQEFEYEFAEILYYTPGKWDKEEKFWPVRAGISQAKPNYRVGPKRIQYYSIHFVMKGAMVLERNGEKHKINQGGAFCLFPHHTYIYYKSNECEELHFCWLVIDGPDAERMLERIGFTISKNVAEKCWSKDTQKILFAILHYLRKDSQSRPERAYEIQSLLYRLFALLIKQRTQVPAATEPKDWIHQVKDYLEIHATEGITIQQAAEMAGVNRSYFSTVFTKLVGITPSEYIAQIRMKKANEMLRNTTASVTEIAYSLGYSNLYAFTRAYKNYFGISPTAYRMLETTKVVGMKS